MSIRLGINPLTWSNDDLRSLGGDIPLSTCLEEARRAGFTGVELGHKFPRQPEVLSSLLRRHDLALVSGWYSLRLLSRDAGTEATLMQPHLDLLQALGCSVVVCAEVTDCIHTDIEMRQSYRPRLSDQEFRVLAERLSDLAESVEQQGLRLAYHHHMGTVIQTEDEVNALMSACRPSVKLLLDTGHLTFAGGDPVRAATVHAPRIAHLHLKDIRPNVLTRVRNDDTSFLEAVLQGVFTVPGDGCIDFAPIADALLAVGYDGWFVVEAEQDPTIADPLTCARKGHAAVSALLDGAEVITAAGTGCATESGS